MAIALQLTDKELIVVNKLAIKSFAEVIVNMFNIVNHLLKLLVANYIKLKAKYIKQILVKRLRLADTNIVLMVVNTLMVEIMLSLLTWLELTAVARHNINYIVIKLEEVGVPLINHNKLLIRGCYNHAGTHAH